MPFSEEPGEIRVSVSTLVEMAARSASGRGVMGDFNHLLRNTKVVVQGETLSPMIESRLKKKGYLLIFP